MRASASDGRMKARRESVFAPNFTARRRTRPQREREKQQDDCYSAAVSSESTNRESTDTRRTEREREILIGRNVVWQVVDKVVVFLRSLTPRFA